MRLSTIVLMVLFGFAACSKGDSAFVQNDPKVWKKGGAWNEVKVVDAATLLVRSNKSNPNSTGATEGVFVKIDGETEKAFSGKKVKVTVNAAQAPENPAEEFAVAYSTNEVGNSNWKFFKVGSEFKDYSFEYKIPPMKKGQGDFVGIHADRSGSGKGILIKGLKVEIVP